MSITKMKKKPSNNSAKLAFKRMDWLEQHDFYVERRRQQAITDANETESLVDVTDPYVMLDGWDYSEHPLPLKLDETITQALYLIYKGYEVVFLKGGYALLHPDPTKTIDTQIKAPTTHHGVNDATRDYDVLSSLAQSLADRGEDVRYNIGIRCGKVLDGRYVLLVVDFDGAQGQKDKARLEGITGYKFDPRFGVKTPNGEHYYFVVPIDRANFLSPNHIEIDNEASDTDIRTTHTSDDGTPHSAYVLAPGSFGTVGKGKNVRMSEKGNPVVQRYDTMSAELPAVSELPELPEAFYSIFPQYQSAKKDGFTFESETKDGDTAFVDECLERWNQTNHQAFYRTTYGTGTKANNSYYDQVCKFAQSIPDSSPGMEGHSKTLQVFNWIIFKYGPKHHLAKGEAIMLCLVWNSWLEIPWTGKELRHKLIDASKPVPKAAKKQREEEKLQAMVDSLDEKAESSSEAPTSDSDTLPNAEVEKVEETIEPVTESTTSDSDNVSVDVVESVEDEVESSSEAPTIDYSAIHPKAYELISSYVDRFPFLYNAQIFYTVIGGIQTARVVKRGHAIPVMFHSMIVVDSGLGKSDMLLPYEEAFTRNKKLLQKRKYAAEKELEKLLKGVEDEEQRNNIIQSHPIPLCPRHRTTFDGSIPAFKMEMTEREKNDIRDGLFVIANEGEVLLSPRNFNAGGSVQGELINLLDGKFCSDLLKKADSSPEYSEARWGALGLIQPGVLRNLLTKKSVDVDRGLFSRFAYGIIPYTHREYTVETNELRFNPTEPTFLDDLMAAIFRINLLSPILRPNDEALRLYQEYADSITDLLNQNQREGKADNLVTSIRCHSQEKILSLASIIHLVNEASRLIDTRLVDQPTIDITQDITADEMRMAIGMMSTLNHSFSSFLDSIGYNSIFRRDNSNLYYDLKKALGYISTRTAKDKPTTLRDLQRNYRNSSDYWSKVIQYGVDSNYIEIVTKTSANGRSHSIICLTATGEKLATKV